MTDVIFGRDKMLCFNNETSDKKNLLYFYYYQACALEYTSIPWYKLYLCLRRCSQTISIPCFIKNLTAVYTLNKHIDLCIYILVYFSSCDFLKWFNTFLPKSSTHYYIHN